ncbi:ATP-citrate synthase [Meloidogyne graminicola]|uniref:ATP-citrate synthase n=1 Tax=Meloidogyne graminicola TaxID=189291 RepID=A0A8S9Z813_9BILA|nr:ATP-citrate synthase [Meloidogyne graminicola]
MYHDARKLLVPVKEKDEDMKLNDNELNELLGKKPDTAEEKLYSTLFCHFIKKNYMVYKRNHFTYILEINPLLFVRKNLYTRFGCKTR